MVLVALLLVALGHRVAGVVLLGGSAVVALVARCGGPPAAALARATAAVDRAARGLASALVAVLMAVTWVVVFLPIWVVNRLARTSALDDGWGQPDSNWRHHGALRRPDGVVPAVGRAAAVEPRLGPGRRGGRLRRIGVVLSIVAALLSLTSGRSIVRNLTRPATDGQFSLADSTYGHDHEPWFRAYIAEQGAQTYAWDPFLALRPVDRTGRYLNVVDHRRVSTTTADPDVTVWFFGGSTMWGIGQRDAHTIPSDVVRLAAADGVRLRAVNLGVPGYTNWQETILLAEMLGNGERPDLIVFYDGANERGTAYSRADRGDPDPAHSWRPVSSPLEDQLLDRSFPANPDPTDAERVAFAAAQYRRGVLTGRSLADGAGVPIVHFWQPQLVSKRYDPADDGVWKALGSSPSTDRPRVDPMLEQADLDGVIDISRVFDDVHEPLFLDWGHTNELGAQLVAEAIYAHLEIQVRALGARS